MPPQAKSHHAPKPDRPTPAQVTIDALADLRAQFGGDDGPERGPEPLGEAGPPESPAKPGWVGEGPSMVAEDTRDEDRAVVIAAWHADTVVTGFMHRGGQCGCRYIANLALDQVRPVQANPEPEPEPAVDAPA